MTTKVIEDKGVAVLRQGKETYKVLIDPNNNEVKAVHISGPGMEKTFSKGTRSDLYSAIKLAKDVVAEKVKDGWVSKETNFGSLVEDVYNMGLDNVSKASKKKGKKGKYVIEEVKDNVPPPPPSIKDLFKMTPVDISKLAKSELEKVARK